MTAIVDLKTTLNTVVPQVLDRTHTPLALTENATDAAFQRTYSNSIETIQRYLRGAGADLRMLAGNQSSLLTAVQVTGELDSATLSAISMLQTAASADTGRVGPGVKQLISMINDIAVKTQALPEDVRQNLNTESKRLFAARNTSAPPPKPVDQQARELMALSDSYLGVRGNPATNTDVLENTGRGLKNYLKAQQEANPDIRVDFTPQRVDIRTVSFMNELLRKRMQEAGVRPEDLQTTLNQLWLLQQNGQQASTPELRALGETAAMSNLVNYIVSGRVPGGGSMPEPPRTDSPWENAVNDRFFSQAVYVDLMNGNVRSQSLFSGPPEQQALMRSIVQQLGLDPNAQTFTRDQIGAIAVEVMVHQAKKLCIEERDITAAMLAGRFNPHQDDLFLANIGMGKPPRDARYEERSERYQRLGISVEMQHDVYFDAIYQEHRTQKWTERFGAVDDNTLFRLVQRMNPSTVPQNMDVTYEDVKDQYQVRNLMEKAGQYGRSPATVFQVDGNGRSDPYNLYEVYRRMREDRYLPSLREKANENRLNLCSTDPGSGGGDGVRPGSATPGAGGCFADDVTGPCTPAGRQGASSGGGDCYADDFRRTCGPDATSGDRIRSNAADGTGQPVNPDTGCYADDLKGPCRTPQASPAQ